MSASSVRMSWSPPSTRVTSRPPAHEGLGHLQADVAAAHHDHVAALRGCGRGRGGPWRRRGSGRRARGRGRCRAGRAGWAGRRWRRGAGRSRAGSCGRAAWSRTSSVPTARSMADDLVAQPHVDAGCSRSSSGAAGDEVVERLDVAGHEVRDAAGGVAGPAAPLEGDDLEVGLPTAGLHGGRHARRRRLRSPRAGQPRAARLPARPVRDFLAWPCGRTVATTPPAPIATGDVVQRCRVRWPTEHAVRLPRGLPLLRVPLDHRRRLAALRQADDDLDVTSGLPGQRSAVRASADGGGGPRGPWRRPTRGRARGPRGRGRRRRRGRGRRRRPGRGARRAASRTTGGTPAASRAAVAWRTAPRTRASGLVRCSSTSGASSASRAGSTSASADVAAASARSTTDAGAGSSRQASHRPTTLRRTHGPTARSSAPSRTRACSSSAARSAGSSAGCAMTPS